jgi:hypothetical protein
MKAGDVISLAMALENLLADEHRRKRVGAASRSIIGNWGCEQCGQGVTAALAGVFRCK